jgi:hypothetical protein
MDVATLLHNLRYPVDEDDEHNNDNNVEENVTKSLCDDEANENVVVCVIVFRMRIYS